MCPVSVCLFFLVPKILIKIHLGCHIHIGLEKFVIFNQQLFQAPEMAQDVDIVAVELANQSACYGRPM